MEIVRNDSDRKHFLQSLFYLNDVHQDRNWRKNTKDLTFPERPSCWPPRKPLVDVWAWTLMPNHFHLILRERREKGISTFMQRLSGSMAARFNAKYQERGSLFQGAYKGRVVSDDADLRWLASYVMVKNTLELYPGGITKALARFDDAWKWGIKYPLSSMGFYAGEMPSPVIATEENVLLESFENAKHFKKDSYDMLKGFSEKHPLALE